MSDSGQYVLRWRGRQSGPFSLDEINRKLDAHEIGLGHEIQCDDQWMSLEEFFARPKPDPERTQRPATPAPTPAGSSARASNPVKSFAVGTFSEPQLTAQPARTPVAATGPAQPKRRLVYALLGILLGFAGVHNYYARHWMTGLLQLLLSVATVLLGFGIIAPWVWAMVEAFCVRKDGDGHEMI